MYFLEAVKICFQKSFTFKGRASRAEYWLFGLFQLILACIICFIQIIMQESAFLTIISLIPYISLPAAISVFVRRLHDVNRSGWWYWIAFTIIGAFFPLLYWSIKPSDPHENQYGLPPVK